MSFGYTLIYELRRQVIKLSPKQEASNYML